MARVLAELLGQPDTDLSALIQRLESAAGLPGVDVRLIAELSATTQAKLKELGLDPNDTTGRELYHALQALVALHDKYLAQIFKAQDARSVSEVLPKIVSGLQGLPQFGHAWVLKSSVAKKLLKKMPPKKIMKHLGYRSVDSLLKREHVGELLCATRFAESQAWQHRLIKQYKHLKPTDFEVRDVEIRYLDQTRWSGLVDDFVLQNHHNVCHLKEYGIILVLPLPLDRMKGLFVTLVPLILHYLAEIRLYSAFFKLEQVKPHFGDSIVDTLLHDKTGDMYIAGQPLHWRTIGRHFGGKSRHQPEVFEPHVQQEDLLYRKAEDLIYRLEPALKFWDGLDFVLNKNDNIRPVSMSLLDNAISYCNGLEYGQHVTYHAQNSLWNELLLRYMSQEALEQKVLDQLSDELVEPVLLGVR